VEHNTSADTDADTIGKRGWLRAPRQTLDPVLLQAWLDKNAATAELNNNVTKETGDRSMTSTVADTGQQAKLSNAARIIWSAGRHQSWDNQGSGTPGGRRPDRTTGPAARRPAWDIWPSGSKLKNEDNRTPKGAGRKSKPDAENRRCTDPNNLDDLEKLFPQVETVEASKEAIGELDLEHKKAPRQDSRKNGIEYLIY
jgi:hypothetical protein